VTPSQLADVLDAAQERFNVARRAVLIAEQRAERARAEVTRMKAGVSAHGDVVGQIAAWSASQVPFDLGPAELPRGLAQARRRLAASQDEHEQAERMLQVLEQEAQQLRQAANAAGAKLRAVMAAIGEQRVEGDETTSACG
jgi:hypothetical protein